MKLKIFITASVLTLAGGCATMESSTIEAGKFVRFECEAGAPFSVRLSEDRGSARLRSKEGSVDLSRSDNQMYAGDGYSLSLAGEKGASLKHKDKMMGERCKQSAGEAPNK
jgi:hypothetical protein